jgi:hypothetical protein
MAFTALSSIKALDEDIPMVLFAYELDYKMCQITRYMIGT